MKVLSVLASTSNPLGMIFTHRQIASLEKLGVENQSFYIPSEGLTIKKLMKTIPALRKTLRQFNPDVVHAQYGMAYAFIAAFTSFRPLVITFHGSDLNMLPGYGSWKNAKKKILSNLAALRAGQIICVSPGLRNNLWWRKSRVQVVPLGVNLEEFFPIDRNEARREMGWPENEVIVLFNANNPKIKRLDIAEKTISIVRKKIPDARLEVLRGTEDNRKAVPVLLNASDCLLLCSDSEGSPMMVKEAMACNIPVVGVPVGDVSDRLRGVEPSKVTGREPEALAAAIFEIVRSGRRSNGRERLIADNLSEGKVAQILLRIYHQVAKH